MVQLSLIAVSISTILSFIPMEEPAVWRTHSSKSSLTISRCAAIISILLWLGFVVRRSVTHGDIGKGFDHSPNGLYGRHQDVPSSSKLQGRLKPTRRRYELPAWRYKLPAKARRAQRACKYRSLAFILYIGLLGFLQDSLVVLLLEFSSRLQVLSCLFGIPLLLKPRLYIDIFLSQGAHGEYMDGTIEATLGTGVRIGLLVGPILVIVGWITSNPMTLVFSTFETIAYGITVWMLMFFVQRQRSTWFSGSLLVGMYIVLALWLVVFI